MRTLPRPLLLGLIALVLAASNLACAHGPRGSTAARTEIQLAYWTVMDDDATSRQYAQVSKQIDIMRLDLERQLRDAGFEVRQIAHPDDARFGGARHLLSVQYRDWYRDRDARVVRHQVRVRFQVLDPDFVQVLEDDARGTSPKNFLLATRNMHGDMVDAIREKLAPGAP